MQIDAVKTSYRRWAPIYDSTFGAVTNAGRRRAAGFANSCGGEVLEVGVGTGLALRYYTRQVAVTGVDYSDDMLAKARARTEDGTLPWVRDLRQMDARTLDFPDASFDHVAAMHLLSVVPEPERVFAEMVRVTRPGGHVLVVNHFNSQSPVMAWIERRSMALENILGWHSVFDRGLVMGDPRLTLLHEEQLPPMGLMTFLVFRKEG